MYCGQCGNKLQEHARQCDNCGKPVRKSAEVKITTINFKKWGIIVVAAILVLIFIPKMFSIGGDMSSPKGTVAGFIKAFQKQDVDKMYKFFVPDKDINQSDLAFFKDQLKEMIKEQSNQVKDYKILDVEIEGKEATVDYMIKFQRGDEMKTTEDSFDLINVGSKWYINDSFSNF